MKAKKLGPMIRTKREKKGLSREDLAKKIKITPGYLGHLERDANVRCSDDLKERIEKALAIRIPRKVVDQTNARSAKWYREYRASKKTA